MKRVPFALVVRPRVSSALLLPLLALVGSSCGTQANGDSPDSGAASATPPSQPMTSAPQVARPARGHAWVVFATDTVVAEVARTDDERARGLMYRDDVPDGTGMLFVFPDLLPRSFWMQNTYVGLDIAYMDAGFEIIDIQQMEPLTTEPHESAGPAMYALEVRRGWFEEKGIAVGAVARVTFGG